VGKKLYVSNNVNNDNDGMVDSKACSYELEILFNIELLWGGITWDNYVVILEIFVYQLNLPESFFYVL
jgi:hypothetical protein